MRGERDELKKGLLNKREPELEELECSHPVHNAKNEKTCSEENTKGVAALLLNKSL